MGKLWGQAFVFWTVLIVFAWFSQLPLHHRRAALCSSCMAVEYGHRRLLLAGVFLFMLLNVRVLR